MRAAGNLSGLICAFSPAGDAFALATQDGRVKTYNTGTGRIRVTLGDAPSALGVGNGHLAEANTCLAWANAHKEKSKKKHVSNALAVGTASGDIKLYDTQLGELKWRAASCIEGGVTAIAYSPLDGGVIIATGASRQIRTLDAATGAIKFTFIASKQAMTCLAISADHRLAFGGGSSLSLFNLQEQQRTAKFSGHPMPARAAAFSPDGLYAASAAGGERHVALWATAPAAKRPKKTHVAANSLALEEPAVQLDVSVVGQAGQVDAMQLDGEDAVSSSSHPFHVAAVSEGGEVYVWLCRPGGDAANEQGELLSSLLARVRVETAATKGTAAGQEECVLAAKLQHGQLGPSLLVAYGSSASPAFQTVQIPPEADVGAPRVISLRPSTAGPLLPSEAAASSLEGEPARQCAAPPTRSGVTVLGAEGTVQPLGVRGTAAEVQGAGGRKRGGEALGETMLATAPQESVEETDASDIPLEARVAALEAAAGLRPSGPGAAEAAVAEQPGTSAVGAKLPIKADSLATLLTQALRSDDKALLERVLCATGSGRVIRNTVARLLPADAVALLRAATDRLITRPTRALQLIPWLNSVIIIHAGSLMSLQSATPALVSLYQAIEARCASNDVVFRLLGRLDLVNYHLKTKQPLDAEAEQEGEAAGPEVVFEDNGSDDVPLDEVDAVGDSSDGEADSGSGDWESADPDELDADGLDSVDEGDGDDDEELEDADDV